MTEPEEQDRQDRWKALRIRTDIPHPSREPGLGILRRRTGVKPLADRSRVRSLEPNRAYIRGVSWGLVALYSTYGFDDEFQNVRDEIQMSVAALFTWIVTILVGLLLLVIWLLEYDREFQSAAATRLPVPVISAHALLGMGGLVLWIDYLLVGEEQLAWITLVDLGMVAALGLIMAARWVHVYRTFADPGPSLNRTITVPPERNFPLPVVITHGIMAVTTLALVLFTVLGAGGS